MSSRGQPAMSPALIFGAWSSAMIPPVSGRPLRLGLDVVVVAALALAGCSSGGSSSTASSTTTRSTTAAAVTTTTAATTVNAGAAADTTKLPLGDGKYVTTAQRGSVDSCITEFHGGGAFRDGPWIDTTAKTWDATKKIAAQGSAHQAGQFTAVVSGSTLQLRGNGLPTTPTGTVPVGASDPAYQYDRNPNSITTHALSLDLPAEPKTAASPRCVGGEIGVSVLGVPIFSAFDALGRDAAAHEVQDACGGHPEITGQYHFHSLSPCLPAPGATGFDAGLFGYARDGFGIYVERDSSGRAFTTADLDECHGRTSEIMWHGRRTTM